MRFCLCGDSALEFWRNYGRRRSSSQVFGHTPNAGPTIERKFPSRRLNLIGPHERLTVNPSFIASYGLGRHGVHGVPVHVLAKRGGFANSSEAVRVHTCAGCELEDSVLVIDQALCVQSPEYCLLSLARGRGFWETLLLCYELCGCYACADSGEGVVLRHPLTSVKELGCVMESDSRLHGTSTLRKVLPYVLDGSGSPRETALALLLCLPQRYGGYGLPLPRLNVNISLQDAAALVWERGNAFDMVWAQQRVVVEYDGEDAHSSFAQQEKDNARRNALVAAGYTVFVLTKSQIASVKKTYGIVLAISKKLGYRISIRSPRFRDRHLALRSTLSI